jgi:Protein of unknown function DUF262
VIAARSVGSTHAAPMQPGPGAAFPKEGTVASVAAPTDLHRRPDARTESVEDLVAAVVRGEVRIPVFQRGLAWTAENVLELFDSIYRGYPIGSLLLRRGPGKAGPFLLGPLELYGEETTHAQWVVDGQRSIPDGGCAKPRAQPTNPHPAGALDLAQLFGHRA